MNCNFINRYLGKLKKFVKNKAQPEGSIANAYIRSESSHFCSYYFDDNVMTKTSRPARNANTFTVQEDDSITLSIFRVTGRPIGEEKTEYLTEKEYKAAHFYILRNCVDVDKYMAIFARYVILLPY